TNPKCPMITRKTATARKPSSAGMCEWVSFDSRLAGSGIVYSSRRIERHADLNALPLIQVIEGMDCRFQRRSQERLSFDSTDKMRRPEHDLAIQRLVTRLPLDVESKDQPWRARRSGASQRVRVPQCRRMSPHQP